MSFAAELRERVRPVLPLAGMVDVLFLLLIFFMTASTFREQEPAIEVALTPAESGEPGDANAQSTVITFTQDNRVFVGDREFSLDEIEAFITSLAEISPDETVYIRGDQYGDYGVGVRLLDYAKAAGFEDVDLRTAERVDQQ